MFAARTMHFGEPTAHQKRCFTRVLQGHIALDSCVLPYMCIATLALYM